MMYFSQRIVLALKNRLQMRTQDAASNLSSMTLQLASILFGVGISLSASGVHAQSATVYSEQGKLLRAPMAVTTLGTDLFGDKVNLSHGGLEFVQMDVSLPGNDSLPVAVGRRLTTGSFGNYGKGLFSHWDLEIPHIHGMFSTNYGWQKIDGSGQPSPQRCSNFGAPPVVLDNVNNMIPFYVEQYWAGNQLYIPGQGDQEILQRNLTGNSNVPTDGQNTPLVTKDLWSIRCLSTLASTNGATVANEAGEGFLAIAPNGTQYRFDWLVSRPAGNLTNVIPTFKQPNGYWAHSLIQLNRNEVWIMPTLVTDRFGNTVRYNYDTVDKWKLLSIQSSDGRSITMTYVPGTHQIATVFDGTRTWTYSYTLAASGRTILNTITLPDNSAWQFADLERPAFGGFLAMRMDKSSDDSDPNNSIWPADCFQSGFRLITEMQSPSVTGSMVHPSGAIGSFTLKPTRHARNGVPDNCTFPRYFDVYALSNKTIAGPGLPSLSWSTTYDTERPGFIGCFGCNSAPGIVSVTDPKGDTTRYSFGSTFRVNEGQLLQTEIGWNGSTALRTTTTRLNTSFTEPVGTTEQTLGDGEINTRHMPVDLRITTQQGVTFTWEVPNPVHVNGDFDDFARPKKIRRSSSLGFSRTETTVYSDNLSKWILGQIDNVIEGSTGAVMVKNTYDTANGNLLNTVKFGLLPGQTFSYYADGTLATSKDGLNQTTTYSNYSRGIAQNILYPNNTSERVTVENRGLITSHTNPATFTTTYGYENSGRLNRITHPTGDDVSWNDTSLVFEPITSAEYDLPAGHWRQTISTGDARTVTYYDALWRPVLTRTFDVNSPTTTSQTVLNKFDHQGKAVYTSYPQRDISGINAIPVGTRNTYDALGRLNNTSADSELGALNTQVDYLAGFQKRVTNPRNFSTTTSYQVFDEPVENAATSIVAPEGLNVAITRDIFGKPKAITRSSPGISATRSYVYDGNQRLCKTLEPEIGATVQDYDAANNVTWRTIGLTLPSLTDCDRVSVPSYIRIAYGYDTLNRLTSTMYSDGSPNITRSYTADGLPETINTTGANPSTWTTTYRNRRLPKQEILSFAGVNYSISSHFDSNGHLDQIIYPDAKVINTAPNALGQASKIDSYATGISYYPNGAVDSFTYGNGIAHKLTQNTRGLPLVAKDNGMLQDTYSYDQNANVTGIMDGTANNTSRSMDLYDGLDRLNKVTAPGIWGVASYTYDVLDNITQSIIGSRTNTHVYDATKNRLTSISSNIGTFNMLYDGYDSQGNITKRGSQAFTFDQGNRLTSATGKASYIYDGLGHRIKAISADGTNLLQIYSPAGQLLYTKQSGGPNPAKEIKYIYLDRHVIAEVAK